MTKQIDQLDIYAKVLNLEAFLVNFIGVLVEKGVLTRDEVTKILDIGKQIQEGNP